MQLSSLKVSVTSRGVGKTQSNRSALALAIVEGNLAKVEEIVDAYIALYQSKIFYLQGSSINDVAQFWTIFNPPSHRYAFYLLNP